MRSAQWILILLLLSLTTFGCLKTKENMDPVAEEYVEAFSHQDGDTIRRLSDETVINTDDLHILYSYFEEHCGSFPFDYERQGWKVASGAGCGSYSSSTTGTYTYQSSSETPCTLKITVEKEGDEIDVTGIHVQTQL